MTVGKSTIGLNTLGVDTIGNENIPAGSSTVCNPLVLQTIPPSDPNAIVSFGPDDTYTTTNIAGGAAVGSGGDPVNTFLMGTGDTVVFACTSQSPSVLNNGGRCGVALLTASGGSFAPPPPATAVFRFFGTGANGQITDFLGNVLASGLSFPSFPYTIQMEVDENTGAGYYVDSDGNSGAIPATGSYAGLNCALASLAEAPLGAGQSVSLQVIDEAPILPLNNPSAKVRCDFA